MATSTITVPSSGGVDQDLIDVATAAKADIEGLTDAATLSASTGAAAVGIADSGNRYTGTTVEAALSEAATSAELASTSNAKGASLVGIEDSGLKYTATTVEDALAEVKTIADAGMTVAKKTVHITNVEIAALGAFTTGTINLGTALPANAHVVSAEVAVATKVQNAGDSDTTQADVGFSGQADGFVKDASLKSTGNKGGGGTAYVGQSRGTAQALVTVHSDVNLDTITAGDLTVTMWYFVLA